MRLGLGFTLLKFIAKLKDSITMVNFPFLVIHGDADQVTLLDGSTVLYEQSLTPTHLKKLVVFPGVRHNVMTEGMAREHAIPAINDWITLRTAPEAS